MYHNLHSYINQLNQKYRGTDVNFLQEHDNSIPNFHVISHNSSVLLSAPHAVKQFRNGIYKGADIYTGAIVEYLCESSSCNGIIRTFNAGDDPNYYSDGISAAYKKAICDTIELNKCKILLDIHGCSDEHAFDVFIGTNRGKNLCQAPDKLDALLQILIAHNINVGVDQENFCAAGKNNISRQTAEKMNIPCMQLEIGKSWRMQPEKLAAIIASLEKYIEIIA